MSIFLNTGSHAHRKHLPPRPRPPMPKSPAQTPNGTPAPTPAPPAQQIEYTEFRLVSSSKPLPHHIMKFRSDRPVRLSEFAKPIKMSRRDPNQPYPVMTTPETEEEAKEAAARALGRPGADTSLIAPMGGAARNKNMMFKKRTKQVHIAEEEMRSLRWQEQKPWVLEDDDGQNIWTGELEGGQSSQYVFFVFSDDGFKVVPADNWYVFTPRAPYQTLTIQEAEERMNMEKKKQLGLWRMKNRMLGNGESSMMGEDEKPASRPRFKVVDHGRGGGHEGGGGGRMRRVKQDEEDADVLDYDDEFQDDEEIPADLEAEDEDVKDSRVRVKREMRAIGAGQASDDDLDADDDIRLNAEGKDLRKLLIEKEKNKLYDDDDDDADPYLSSDEAENEEENGSESNKDTPTDTPKRPSTPNSTTKSNVFSRSGVRKPASKGKEAIYMDGLSRSSSGHSSPMYIKKESGAMSSLSRSSTSPMHRPASPPRALSPSATSPARLSDDDQRRKLKRTASERNGEAGTKKKVSKKAKAPGDAASPTSPTSPMSQGSPSAETPGASSPEPTGDLITEEDVIEVLSHGAMTTKTFLSNFKKQLKSNPLNKDNILKLLRKVARQVDGQAPGEKLMELRPEFAPSQQGM